VGYNTTILSHTHSHYVGKELRGWTTCLPDLRKGVGRRLNAPEKTTAPKACHCTTLVLRGGCPEKTTPRLQDTMQHHNCKKNTHSSPTQKEKTRQSYLPRGKMPLYSIVFEIDVSYRKEGGPSRTASREWRGVAPNLIDTQF